MLGTSVAADKYDRPCRGLVEEYKQDNKAIDLGFYECKMMGLQWDILNSPGFMKHWNKPQYSHPHEIERYHREVRDSDLIGFVPMSVINWDRLQSEWVPSFKTRQEVDKAQAVYYYMIYMFNKIDDAYRTIHPDYRENLFKHVFESYYGFEFDWPN